MWRWVTIAAVGIGLITVAVWLLCLLVLAAPGFLALLFLLPVFHASVLPSWEDELKAWLERP
jgi:hypothetical protein